MARRIHSILSLLFIIVLAIQPTQARSGKPQNLKSAPPAPAKVNASFVRLQTAPALLAKSIARALLSGASAQRSATLSQVFQGRQLALAPPTLSGSTITALSWNEVSGVPRAIAIAYRSAGPGTTLPSATEPLLNARNFLASNTSLLRISDPASEFALTNAVKDEQQMTHMRFRQMYAGIEVWASDVYVHAGPDGRVVFFNGTYHPTPTALRLAAAVDSLRALAVVSQDLASRGDIRSLPPMLERVLGDYGPTARKVIWYDRSEFPHLVWFVEDRTGLARDWYYFVDAQTGTVLHYYNTTETDGPSSASANDLNGVSRTFGTYLASSDYYMVDASQPMYNGTTSQVPQNPVGAIVALDLRGNDLNAQSTVYFVDSPSNTWTDATSVSAQYNAGVVYNFYRTVFGRNSIDDNGMTIYSIIHVTQNGQAMDNAFWSGSVMCYGDGNTSFKPLAGGFDVAAHEMTHGVTQHTANLVYQDQSGALNESMSDVFAAVVDSANWTIGEQVIKDFTSFPSGSLRDLSNPHNGGSEGTAAWQPATMAEFVSTTQDNGGVHVNSGIPNNAFYRVATAIGRSPAAAVWYRALTHYLTSSAKFVDARIATEAAAKELYGNSSAELTAVQNAWDAVGVLEGTSTQPPPSSQVVGTSWVLAVNTASSDPNSIYMIKPVIQSSNDFSPLSSTPVLTRPAVSDTSGIVLFVDGDHRLRGLDANPANPQEGYLDTNSVWWSVAIGPGTTSLALTSRFIDTTIYYIDYVNKTAKQFKIRTTAYDGTPVATALYSDALSFDPTGRYLLFDAYNKTTTVQGDSISFWTIDLLDVTTGEMHSVFPPQAEAIDLGDPMFSRSSGSRFAFDYWDEKAQTDHVMGADFFTGNSGPIAGPLPDVGFPTYSGDGLAVAFHTLQSVNGTDHDAIQQIGVDSSGIAPIGSAVDYVTDATFPFWFVIGNRVTAVEPSTSEVPASFSLSQNYPNPFNPTTVIRVQGTGNSWVKLVVYDVLGQEVRVLANGRYPAGQYSFTFDATGLASGMYFYRLTAGSYTAVRKMALVR
ncbi:MAG: M4 family metallopeptidase [Bacteroidota bacterium]